MATYRNGKIPERLLIQRGAIKLTAGTWAKWDRFVSIVKKRHGVTMTITQGSGASRGSGGYRSKPMQRAVKDKYVKLGKPGQAAAVGTSSHGGEFKGRDALAIDVNNYFLISEQELFAAAREAGFEPGYFDGRQGRPDEPWHFIDWDPYRTVKPTPKPKPTPVLPAEPDLMEYVMEIGYVYNADPYDRVYAINPVTGKKRPLTKAEWEAQKINGAKAWPATKAQVDEIPNG